MYSTRDQLIASDFPALSRQGLECLQVNLGYTCNLSCSHCHVNAGPSRREQMDLETVNQVIEVIRHKNIKTLDLTGGAPEMNPHFSYLVERATALGVEVIDRCNLTILLEPGYEWLAEFLASKRVTVVASLPCYSETNVAEQRGKGVFEKSISALQKLNQLGYGKGALPLNLVYNPNGAFLPPPQQQLEQDYKKELWRNHGIQFNSLYTITNMPISRFGAVLHAKGALADYMTLLQDNFDSSNLSALMCKTTVSVDWQGWLYDCDFNQMLNLPLKDLSVCDRERLHVKDLLQSDISQHSVVTGQHCYGCAAGQGSSCGGALA
jgi:Predicted Fe-S oxidoreductases